MKTFRVIPVFAGALDAVGRAMIALGAMVTLLGGGGCTGTSDTAKARPAVSADSLGFPAPDRPTSTIVAPRWTDEDERDRLDEAARVIALARVRPGMTVADIGAGDGYYVARLSPLVGPTGRVLGEDIMPEYLDLLRRRVAREGLGNVDVVQGTPDDPRLPRRSVDVALLIHMYHEITRPFELLWHLSAAMKPGGTVAILDQDGPTDRHGTPPALLTCELGAFGFTETSRTTLGDGAYVALFSVPTEPVAPARVRARLSARPCAVAR
ncbi:MAG: class I SAM-dependent methyltransferase [Gemmatimonadaceae bacterium]